LVLEINPKEVRKKEKKPKLFSIIFKT